MAVSDICLFDSATDYALSELMNGKWGTECVTLGSLW